MKTFFVSPSDMNYLYDNCPRCWYRKLHKLQRPAEVIPAIFGAIDLSMKSAYDVETLRGFDIPAIRTVDFEWVKSAPIEFPEYGVSLVVRGKFDKAAVLEDKTMALVEFKTTELTPEKIKKFSRQLHAYELALRVPEKGKASEISQMHLIGFEPAEEGGFTLKEVENRWLAAFKGRLSHREVPIDRSAFEEFLREMASVAGGDLPAAGSNCTFCMAVADAVRWEMARAA